MAKDRRVGSKDAPKRILIMDVTQRLMLNEGYAAVSTRRVAAEAGMKPPLVHYYFPTTDDLFLAVYHRAVDVMLLRLDAAVNADRPLHAMWEVMSDSSQTSLAVEFMALANHREAIAADLAKYTELARQRQADALQRVVGRLPDRGSGTPEALALLMAGIGRTLVLEGGLGISLGHHDVRTLVLEWLDQVEPSIAGATPKAD